jgi:hypothetical protein
MDQVEALASHRARKLSAFVEPLYSKHMDGAATGIARRAWIFQARTFAETRYLACPEPTSTIFCLKFVRSSESLPL